MSERVSIGVDIGGTSAKLGVVDARQRVLARGNVATGSIEPERLARTIGEACRRLVGECEGSPELDAVGLGCAGLVDVGAGVIRLSPNLPGWRDVPLRELVQDAIGTSVSLINDANAFGYGEHRHGAGRGKRLGVYVTLGTGVGGAVLGETGFLEGAHGLAGEIGHMCVAIDGPPCPCGARGCLEVFVGSARIVELAERKVRSGAPGEAIRRASERDGGPVTPRAIATAAEDGDWTARAVYAEIGEIVGSALAGVANLLDPDVVVIGGGVALAGEVLFSPIRRAFDRQVIAPEDVRAAVEPAHFGADAGLVGAAAFARDES